MKLSLLKREIERSPEFWTVPLMDFVDNFRRRGTVEDLDGPLTIRDDNTTALVASVIEHLCDEKNIDPPPWVHEVPSCKDPWFVSGIENLKAIALVESPIHFRKRKIFVLENFLDRV